MPESPTVLRFSVTEVAWPEAAAFDLYRASVQPAREAWRSGRVSESPWLDRAAAAREIARQNPGLPAPPEQASYVIGGQQAGLLTGPLYTVLKATTAIALACRVTRALDRPVLPLFWIASEDHDVLEVNRLTVNGRRFVHDYPGDLARCPRSRRSRCGRRVSPCSPSCVMRLRRRSSPPGCSISSRNWTSTTT